MDELSHSVNHSLHERCAYLLHLRLPSIYEPFQASTSPLHLIIDLPTHKKKNVRPVYNLTILEHIPHQRVGSGILVVVGITVNISGGALVVLFSLLSLCLFVIILRGG